MPTPIEAYRQGYEKGRSDSAGGRLAEITMGMLRDDPGGHSQKGYSDGAAGRPFDPPSIPAPKRLQANGLIPKFSENPLGWLLAVLIIVEFWALWQLIKAPFQLVGSLMRSEKPSASVIVRNIMVAGLAIAMVWIQAKEKQVAQAAPQTAGGQFSAGGINTAQTSGLFSVSVTDDGVGHTALATINGAQLTLNDSDLAGRWAIFSVNQPHDMMNLMCPNNATFVGASSSTGNSVPGPALGYALTEITPGRQNNLTIQCRK